MQIILHIGTHKTASTALQWVYNQAREELVQSGIYYPAGQEQWPGHPRLAWWFRDGAVDHCRTFLDETVAEAKRLNCQRVLLSSEEFSHIGLDHISLLKEYGKVSVVCFLRVQDEYLESSYNQNVKSFDSRFTGSIFEFYMYHNFDLRLNYHTLLKRWAREFGDQQITVYPYKKQGGREDIYIQMFRELNVPRLDLAIETIFENHSVSSEAIRYIRELNRLNDLSHQQHQMALEWLATKFPERGKRVLPAVFRQRLNQRYRKLNQQVAKRYSRIEDKACLFADQVSSEEDESLDSNDQFDPSIYLELLESIGYQLH